jgi:hypothetical protein
MKREYFESLIQNYLRNLLKVSHSTGVVFVSLDMDVQNTKQEFLYKEKHLSERKEQANVVIKQVISDKKERLLAKENQNLPDGFIASRVYSFPMFDDSNVLKGVLYFENILDGSSYSEAILQNIRVFSSSSRLYIQLVDDFEREYKIIAKEKDELEKTKESIGIDYYLIAELLDILQSNLNSTENIHTEFFIEQKKKFSFYNEDKEIGGDLCKTDTIFLNDGQKYTVFINGDAMGKSLQGASGSIVLGVVFDAIVSRSKNRREHNYDVYPEIWLKETFLDIHNVFRSFKGNMYTSFCLGLIHSETGIMYYVNAEHPPTIIYKDGVASFIEFDSQLNKAGTFYFEQQEVQVRLCRLDDGESIFTGSDGKDDLAVYTSDGQKIIVHEDDSFLKIIQDSEGRIDKISENIKTQGELIDDISLLKITYKTKHKKTGILDIPNEIYTIIENSNRLLKDDLLEDALQSLLSLEVFIENLPELARFCGKIYYYQKNLARAIELFHYYNDKNPDDNLYLVSPIYLASLETLGRLYYLKEDNYSAIECFDEYLYIDPTNSEIMLLLSIVNARVCNFKKSLDISERLYLRDKNNFENLIHYSKTHLKQKSKEKAIFLIKKALELQPDNEEAKELYQKYHK